MTRETLTGPQIIAALTPKRKGRQVSPKEQRTWEGRTYHSRAEMAYAQELELMRKAGLIQSWEPQFPLEMLVNGTSVCFHFVDFRVIERNGKSYFVEVKGHEEPIWRFKVKVLKALYPCIDYRVVKV